MSNQSSSLEPIVKRVLERIEDEHVVPRPRWEFIFQNYFFWGLGALAVVLGAFAFSAIVFDIENMDWSLAAVTHGNVWLFLLDAAPFLWIGTLFLFIIVGYLNVRHTRYGYRYSLPAIAVGAVLSSVALGGTLYAFGLGEVVDDLPGKLPFHQPILEAQKEWWQMPTKGLLGGTVASVTPNISSFSLKDSKGVTWQIDASDLRTPDLVAVARGGKVRVVGILSSTTTPSFHGCFVLPWEAPRGVAMKRGKAPSPLAAIASTSERSPSVPRSESCKGLGPYKQLRQLDDAGF